MKSEHRHELQTNELADFIGRIPEYLRENALPIIGIVIIIIGIISWPFLKKRSAIASLNEQVKATRYISELDNQKMRAMQSRGGEFSGVFLVSANDLNRTASEAKNDAVAALALIKRAQAFRTDLHYKAGPVEREVLANHIRQAREAYNRAITKAKGNQTLIAMAKFGLGLCAEELGEYDKATEIYKAIESSEDFEGTVFPERARFRLATMGDHNDKFVFAKAPEVPQVDFEQLVPIESEPVQMKPVETGVTD